MQANLETLGKLERRLSVSVPLDEIEGEVQTRLKRLSRTVKVHGFRPGKVPLKVVAQQYGPQVRQEVLGDTLQKTFGDAVQQQNLKVAGQPQFEAKPMADGASLFEYSATFEIYPEISLGDISSTTIIRSQLDVREVDVDKTLEIMRKQRVTYDPADRAAESGDRLKMSYRGTLGGEPFAGGSAEDQNVLLGGSGLLPDFESQLAGMKAGESKTFDLRFPDDYHGKEVAGKTATFEVSLSEVAGPRLPEVDAEFAKALGVADGDLTRMRAEIRSNLEREVKARLKARIKDQVMQGLLDATPIEAPKSLVSLEVQRLQQMARQDLAARGIPVREDIQLPLDMFEQQAQRRVNLGLILGELVRAQNLYARPEQVRALVEEQAQSYEHPDEVVKWYYQAPERLREMESLVIEENVVSWALAAAKVEDKPLAFDELMENRK